MIINNNRYGGHSLFERGGRGSKDASKKGSGSNSSGSSGGGEGASIGGNVFWKQWHFPVRTRGRNVGEDEDDYYGLGGEGGSDGYGYGGDASLARAAEEEREFESSDRRPWTDLIPRFRVKVEPMTTLKVNG